MSHDQEMLPVMRPALPDATRLLPYLRRIDDARSYSNFGPLALELEHRLAAHFDLPAGCLTSASSGTTALLGAIFSTAGRATEGRPYALIPAFTFVATAAAVEQCGYHPYLADVDANTWLLDPSALLRHPELDRIGLVVPVAALGRPVDLVPWLKFRELTNIPVVVDGAASFDGMAGEPRRYVGTIPVTISFHATKSFATGEGGCIVSTDADLIARAAGALNFGFCGVRECRSASTNGKMSEYHAAVGLAELDGWNGKKEAMRDVADRYRRRFSELGISDRFFGSPDIGLNYALFLARRSEEAETVIASLQQSDVEYRRWYGRGLHRESYYSGLPHQGLAVTENISSRLLGLPFAADISDDSVERVMHALRAGIAG